MCILDGDARDSALEAGGLSHPWWSRSGRAGGGGALLHGDARDGHVTEWLKGPRDRFILQRKSRAIPPAVLLCV